MKATSTMRYFFGAIILIAVIWGAEVGRTEKDGMVIEQSASGQGAPLKCSANSDNLYNRREVLEQLAGTLNNSVPEFRRVEASGFYVQDEKGIGFFIYDLTDVSNKGTPLYNCINFRNHHVYHFAPISQHYSLSHILILEDGNLKIFKSINCKDRGDKLEDVVNYLKQQLKNDNDKDEIISRVKNYRKYGQYVMIDDSSLICPEVGK